MSRPLPPLNALRAFEATARHASFTRAAAELHVTPAALSHQIRGLEEYLGHKLFHRKSRAIGLTTAGDLIYPGLNAAFTQVRRTMELLDQTRDDRVLVVSTPPGFTAKWLAPRLYRFLAANPEIDTRISSTQAFANFTSDGVDVAIRNAHAPFPGLFSERLFAARMLPVLSSATAFGARRAGNAPRPHTRADHPRRIVDRARRLAEMVRLVSPCGCRWRHRHRARFAFQQRRPRARGNDRGRRRSSRPQSASLR